MIDRLISVPHLNQTELYAKWKNFIQGKSIETSRIYSLTYKAWQRCVGYNLDPFHLEFVELAKEDLRHRKLQSRGVLNLLQPHIQTIKTTVSTYSEAYIIAIADHEGYILEAHVNNKGPVLNSHCYPGICFDEKNVGNNGIGTVLVTGKPLAVIGAEHFSKDFHGLSCVGAPITGEDGNVLAVLAVAIPCSLESPYTFSITVAAAKAVEAALRHGEMEKQLSESQKTLSLLMQQREIIFNAMSQGVIILNKQGRVTFFNKAAENIWGIHSSEILGKKYNRLNFYQCRRQDPLLLLTIREGKAFTNIECRCRNKQHDKSLLVNTSLLRDEHDGVNGAIGIYTDVTEMRRQEARLREQQKLAVVGQMAAGMAHEIRNPLTSVRGFAQLMSERWKEENSTFREYMQIMIQEIDQADSFIKNFLQLAKPKLPQKKLCSLNELIFSFVRIFESQAFLQGVKLVTQLQDVPQIVADPDQIRQVLLNLCQNALHAMTNGTITLVTSYHQEHQEVCLSVIDDGPGIPAENLEKLGTPFFTTKDQGTGLGLSICYTIVDRHRGRIEVDSRVGEGTRFSVYLPVDELF